MLQEQLEQKERVISELQSYTKVLRQNIHDGDQARHDAFMNILENQDPSKPTSDDHNTPLKLRRCQLKGTVDEELKEALEELKAFKPLQTPVGWEIKQLHN